MAENKKGNIGGIPGIYRWYIAALAVASVLIYVWNTYFVTQPPEQYTIRISKGQHHLFQNMRISGHHNIQFSIAFIFSALLYIS